MNIEYDTIPSHDPTQLDGGGTRTAETAESILSPEQQAAFGRLCALGYFTTSDYNLFNVFGSSAGVIRDQVVDPEYGYLYGGNFALMGDAGPMFGDCRDETAQLVFKWVITGDNAAFELLANAFQQRVAELETVRARAAQNYQKKEKEKNLPRAGYIYVIKAGDHYKIGHTKQPTNRAKTHQTSNPLLVEEILLVPVKDMTGTEDALHDLFADKRGNGEWFMLTEPDIQTIRNYFGIDTPT